MRIALTEYVRRKKKWRAANQFCVYPDCRRRAEKSPHHKRGRLGTLLIDEHHWIALCRKHHNWVHDNINAARALGLMAQPGEWNTEDKNRKNQNPKP